MLVPIAVLLFFVNIYVEGFDLHSSEASGFNDRLLELEMRLEKQNQRIETLEKSNKELRDTVNDMNLKINTNENELTGLRKQVAKLTHRDQEHQRTISSLQNIISELTADFGNDPFNDINTHNKTDMIQSVIGKIRRTDVPMSSDQYKRVVPAQSTSHTVAFYAYMSTSESQPSVHHTLIFDVETIDIGGGYNPYTGIFTVPVDGIYAFSFSVRVFCHSYATVEITRNGNVIGAILADSEEACDNDMSTGVVVVSAVKGDAIFVRTHATFHEKGQMHNNNLGRASFCGWLIA